MSNLTVSATAADVRAFFNHPRYGASRLAKVSPDAQHTVKARTNLRGRLHKEAVEAFNAHDSHVKKGVAYFTGATKEAVASQRADALAARVQAFDAGLAVGARGPLSNETRKALGMEPITRKGKGKSPAKGK